MSVVCTVAGGGAVYVGVGVLTSLASATAASMAMREIEATEEETLRRFEALRQNLETVELASTQSEQLSGLVAERCCMLFGGEDISLELTRDVRGKLTVRAHGENMSRAELAERSERFLGLLMQQVAYREVVTRMKRYGLDVQQEARLEDGTVKVRIGGRRR